jgi:hypothetical protein
MVSGGQPRGGPSLEQQGRRGPRDDALYRESASVKGGSNAGMAERSNSWVGSQDEGGKSVLTTKLGARFAGKTSCRQPACSAAVPSYTSECWPGTLS